MRYLSVIFISGPLLLGGAFASAQSSSTATGPQSSSMQSAAAQGLSSESAASVEQSLGTSSYSALATPAAGGAAGAESQVSAYVDVPCTTNPGTAETAAGVEMIFEGCQGSGDSVKSVTLEICDKNLSGEMCAPSDFTVAKPYPVGVYTPLTHGSLGIGCDTSSDTCRLTVTSQYAIEGTGSQITAQANEQADSQTTRQMLAAAVSQVQPSAETQTTSESEQSAAAANQDEAYSETASSTQQATTPVASSNSEANFQNALVAAGTASGVSQSTSATGPTDVRVFGGDDMRCTTPVGSLGNSFSANCCDINLTQSGNGLIGKCDASEVNLAAERRALRTVYIGSYCSKEQHLAFFSRCIQETQTYCAFGGVLSRLIQEQGREQLAAAASSANGTAQTRALTFPLFQGAGGWTQPFTLNGEAISIYEAPASCASQQAGPNCPVSIQLWFAVCSQNGCGQLPQDPQDGSTTWQIAEINTLSATEQALSDHVVAAGSCDQGSGQCQYTFTAWPPSSDGEVVQTKPLRFLATDPSTEIAEVVIGNNVVKVTSPHLALGTTWPSSIAAQVSSDGGTSWRAFSLPLTASTPISISTGGSTSSYGFTTGAQSGYWGGAQQGVTVIGGCDASTAVCQYALTGRVQAIPKPWGVPKNPDCTGFTVAQLSMLDFSKMDLSEYLQQVGSQVSLNQSQILGQALSSSAGGGAASTAADNPVPSEVAVIQPTEDMGPFTATLSIAPTWQGSPQGNDPIFGVRIDWGDCSPQSQASQLVSGGFRAYHTYRSPASAGMCDENGPAGPGRARDLTHQITLYVNAQDGTHQMTLQVRNDYYSYSAGN